MRTLLLVMAALLGMAATATPVFGQGARDVYKVDFTIRDSGDAGGKSGRKYSLQGFGGNKTTFKIGNRVPVPSGGDGSMGSRTQYTYVDVGVNLDCIVQEVGGKMGIHADMDLSTAVNAEKNPGAAPTISQIRLNIDTAVAGAKPTVVAAFDDPVTARKFEVEVTVTKVN
jgi:hypothetical protein